MKTLNMPKYFRPDSALLEFLEGRLGAPDCWPNDREAKASANRVLGPNVTRVSPGRIATAHQSTPPRLVDAGI
jgi:hypothetical protein